jgi:hypothetical protein
MWGNNLHRRETGAFRSPDTPEFLVDKKFTPFFVAKKFGPAAIENPPHRAVYG